MSGWYGVDLDGTLAEYDGWQGIRHIGEPVPLMRERVMVWLAEGREVRIFTARVCPSEKGDHELARAMIENWCMEHLGQVLLVTNEKDFGMIELWDDRCVQVEKNTGRRM